MIRRPPRSTLSSSSAASDVYKRQTQSTWDEHGNPLSVSSASSNSENNKDNYEELPAPKCGYPYKFFKNQSEFLNVLRCTANSDNIISLRSVQDHDGNLYCRDCFTFKKRKYIGESEPQQAPYKIIETLAKNTVVCLHQDCGCKFEGMYSEIEDHLKNYCDFEKIECENCHKEMTRPAFYDHSLNCEFRRINCKYCGEELLFSNQQIHEQNECQQIPITCHCGKTLPKSELDSHKEECDLQYCEICNITVKKTELDEHYAKDISKHLIMFGGLVTQIEQLNTELEEEKALRKKIKQMINCKVGNLEFGSQCNICFRKLEQQQPQFYCHTCHVWFCEECANQEKLNKSGSEKLSHPHNLTYINVVNSTNLGNIEPYKFGHNIYFKKDYSEIQKSICCICDQQSQYQKKSMALLKLSCQTCLKSCRIQML
eukprot:TRINITY_DN6132_c0_g1_i3.p1 TRINITY_DN6132_c0_g1~~TRINITY_DN6132_c0_g1_i3.p1  ORF type:complete len:428 (+),score=70.84 TRINITY_DN6132_c0_g1_i3:140-1423(+)